MAKVTLSFDNGPSPEATPRVLDILKAKGLRASFFVVGRRLEEPGADDLLRRMRDEGHWIGNHTLTHRTPLGLLADGAETEREIVEAQARLAGYAHPDKFFRPFGDGGHKDRRLLNRAAVERLCADGYSCVLWNSVPRDWENPAGWDETARADCAAQTWTLLVLHDIPGAADDRLGTFLTAVAQDGHEIVQDFPPDCVPIRCGEITGTLDGIVAS
jgi:peptidoglycan/xylan/chitin deacetylase (PgdA/CDA1 family)